MEKRYTLLNANIHPCHHLVKHNPLLATSWKRGILFHFRFSRCQPTMYRYKNPLRLIFTKFLECNTRVDACEPKLLSKQKFSQLNGMLVWHNVLAFKGSTDLFHTKTRIIDLNIRCIESFICFILFTIIDYSNLTNHYVKQLKFWFLESIMVCCWKESERMQTSC